MKIKKILTGFLVLSMFFCGMHLVKANDSETDTFPVTVEGLQVYLDNFTEEYLKNNDVSEHYQLSALSMNDLSNKIQDIKDRFYGTTLMPLASLDDYTGGIMLEFKSNTLGFPHGHAALGYEDGTIEILGPDYTVQQENSDHFRDYWETRTTGGFYTVRGATKTNNNKAGENAYDVIGSGYGLAMTPSGGFTCSNLVEYAWDNVSGFNGKINGITPQAIENSAAVVKQWSW